MVSGFSFREVGRCLRTIGQRARSMAVDASLSKANKVRSLPCRTRHSVVSIYEDEARKLQQEKAIKVVLQCTGTYNEIVIRAWRYYSFHRPMRSDKPSDSPRHCLCHQLSDRRTAVIHQILTGNDWFHSDARQVS
jgi:hypothetical protein